MRPGERPVSNGDPPLALSKHPSIQDALPPLILSITSIGDMSHMRRKSSPAVAPKTFHALVATPFNNEPRTAYRHTIMAGIRTSRLLMVRIRCAASNLVAGFQRKMLQGLLGRNYHSRNTWNQRRAGVRPRRAPGNLAMGRGHPGSSPTTPLLPSRCCRPSFRYNPFSCPTLSPRLFVSSPVCPSISCLKNPRYSLEMFRAYSE